MCIICFKHQLKIFHFLKPSLEYKNVTGFEIKLLSSVNYLKFLEENIISILFKVSDQVLVLIKV